MLSKAGIPPKNKEMEHFKALPVVDEQKKPLGHVSRTDVAEEALARGAVPNIAVENIMETPPYTVDAEEAIGTVKRLMKELGVHRLVVTEKGKVIGVVSTFDLAMFAEKPKKRQHKQLISEVKRIDDLRIKDFLRDSFVRAEPQELLPEVLKKMVSNRASYAVVVEEGKQRPLGVLPLKTLFAFMLKMASPTPQIVISHMPEDDGWMYDEVKDLLLAAVSKAEKMFDVGHIHVNVKEGKSVYKVDVTLELDSRPYHFHAQDYELGMAFRKVADHIERVVAKTKDIEKHRKVDVEPYEESEYL